MADDKLAPKGTGAVATGLATRAMRTGVGGWVEDKGNRLLDKGVAFVGGFLGSVAVSLKDWLAHNWLDAARAVVLAGVATYFLYRLARAWLDAAKTNRLVLESLSRTHNDELGRNQTALSASVTPQTMSPAPAAQASDAVMVYVTPSAKKISGIGIVIDVGINYYNNAEAGKRPRGNDHGFEFYCDVNYVGLVPDAEASPTEVILSNGSGDKIAQLELLYLPKCAGVFRYQTKVAYEPDSKEYKALEASMDRRTWFQERYPELEAQGKANPPQRMPKVCHNSICKIRVSVPAGKIGIDHGKSRFALDFELGGHQYKELWIMVRPVVSF